MNKRAFYVFAFCILFFSCHKYDAPKSLVTLDGRFDTTVVAVNGGETCIGIKDKIMISDTVCIRVTIMRRDHDGSFAQILQTDSLFDDRKNLIRTVERECMGLKDTVFFFAGHPVLCVSPSDSSSWIEKNSTILYYSDQGKCYLREYRDADRQLLFSMIFNYDEEGKLLSVFEKKNGIDHPQIRKQYDKAGHLVEELSEIGKTEYEYDSHGKCILRRFNDITELNKYDSNGNLSESVSYYSDKPEFSIEYKYGRVRGKSVLVSKTQHFYQKSVMDPEQYAIYEYKYDKRGRIVIEKELLKLGKGDLLHDRDFRYSYDDRNKSIVMKTRNNLKDKSSDEIFKYYSIRTK